MDLAVCDIPDLTKSPHVRHFPIRTPKWKGGSESDYDGKFGEIDIRANRSGWDVSPRIMTWKDSYIATRKCGGVINAIREECPLVAVVFKFTRRIRSTLTKCGGMAMRELYAGVMIRVEVAR